MNNSDLHSNLNLPQNLSNKSVLTLEESN